MPSQLSPEVRVALAIYDREGWKAVPPHLLMAVQMIRNGHGCASCGAVGR